MFEPPIQEPLKFPEPTGNRHQRRAKRSKARRKRPRGPAMTGINPLASVHGGQAVMAAEHK